MSFVRISLLAAAFSAIPAGAGATQKASAAKGRPNIVFIYTDDQRWDALGVVQREQGERARFPWLKTPHLDRLAAQGTRFRNAFVVNSLCAPSRASFLTGQYGHKNGIVNNHTPFDAKNVTWATLLRAAGYVTGYIGKWHMGPQRGQRPGFDYSASFVGQGKYFDCPVEINGESTPTQGWIDDVSADFAIRFLRENRARSFALVVGFKATHGPFTPPPRHANTYEGEEARPVPNLAVSAIYKAEAKKAKFGTHLQYFRCISAIDDNVGKLLAALDELGLADNTIVIFTSDNGYYLGEHGLGDKRTAYEESLRIPFLVRASGHGRPGQVLDPMILNVDLAPTLLDLAGVPIPKQMHGRSWKPLLDGRAEDWRKSFFYCYFYERKYAIPTTTAVRTDTAVLIKYPGHEEWTEVFDLVRDPYQLKNLARDAGHAGLRRELEAEYERQVKAIDFHIPDFADEKQKDGGGAPDALGLTDHPINEWVRQSPSADRPAPAFGWEGSGAYDPQRRTWIHYGGHDGIPQGFPLFTFDLTTGAWQQRFPNTSPNGVCCVDGAAAFDVAQRRFVRFPGGTLGHGYQWSRAEKLKNSAVWLYDPAANTWANMRPAPYRPYLASEGLGSLNAAATYDPNHELTLSFGGQGSSGGTNNLFAYDAYTNELHRLDAANRPSPRDGMGLAYDAKHDCLVMFGSQYASDEKTWIYRYATNRWESHALEPHPLGKKGKTYSTIPRLCYDSLHEIVLCLTRDDEKGAHETWALDVGKLRWQKLEPRVEASPSMSRSRNLDFSPEHNLFILETVPQGRSGKGPEIWTYRYAPRPPVSRPEAPRDLQMATDSRAATLTWTAPTEVVKEYEIFRAEADKPGQEKFAKVATVTDTRWRDEHLGGAKAHVYQVRAIGSDGRVSGPSFRARTQPRVPAAPVVSVLASGVVEVRWQPQPAEDVVGYNLYAGLAQMRAVKKGELKPWRDNDPEYAQPLPVEVRDIPELIKLNQVPVVGTTFVDRRDSLALAEAAPTVYRYRVVAYVLKAVNRLGVESGPSPYALSIPSAPTQVLCREAGENAELKWHANPESDIRGYHIYKLGKGVWEIVRVTDTPVPGTTFTHKAGRGTTRYWVVAVDALGQEGEPSAPVWFNQSYKGFYEGEWHQ